MTTLLFLGVVSFVISMLLTPLCRKYFLQLGYVDHPDGVRKSHSRPIATMGGVAVVAAYAISFIVLYFAPANAPWLRENMAFVLRVLPAGIVILATGILDDLFGLNPVYKLGGQLVAATWAYWAGVRIVDFGGHWTLDWWAFPLTILWLLLCTNAFNLIDGIDGLAAGLGFLATVTVLLCAMLNNHIYLAAATVPLAGALLGFLWYNFFPASIFLGDSGSLFIGFILGCFGVIWSQKSTTLLGMTAPAMTMAVPMIDVGISIVRRMVGRRPIFAGDRSHIHHKLLDFGLGHRGVSLILYAVSAVAALFSVALSIVDAEYSRLIIIAFCIAAGIGVGRLRYVEFKVVRRVFFGGDLQTMVNSRLVLEALESALASTRGIGERRGVVERACRELGFCSMEMSLQGELSYVDFSPSLERQQCEIRVPLGGSDYVILRRGFFDANHSMVIMSFVDTLRAHLGAAQGQAVADIAPHESNGNRREPSVAAGLGR